MNMKYVYLLLDCDGRIVFVLSSMRAALRVKSLYRYTRGDLFIRKHIVYSNSDF